MVHVFQMFNFLEPATKAMDSVGYFVKNIIPIHQRNQRNTLLSQSSFSMLGNKLPYPVELNPQDSTPGYMSPSYFSPNKVDKSTSTQDDGIIVNHPPSNYSYSKKTKDYKPTCLPSHHYPMM